MRVTRIRNVTNWGIIGHLSHVVSSLSISYRCARASCVACFVRDHVALGAFAQMYMLPFYGPGDDVEGIALPTVGAELVLTLFGL